MAPLLALGCLISGTIAFGADSTDLWTVRMAAESEYAKYRAQNPTATPEERQAMHATIFASADKIAREDLKKSMQNKLDALVMGSQLPDHNARDKKAVKPDAPAANKAKPDLARAPAAKERLAAKSRPKSPGRAREEAADVATAEKIEGSKREGDIGQVEADGARLITFVGDKNSAGKVEFKGSDEGVKFSPGAAGREIGEAKY